MSRNRGRHQPQPVRAPTSDKAFSTNDSYSNFLNKTGIGTQNQASAGTYTFNLLTRNPVLLEAQYRGSWIVGKMIDAPAEDMTREGIEFQGMDPDDAEKLGEALDDLEINDQLCDTLKWGSLYGGAIAVMLIDGQKPETPMRPETIQEGQFRGLQIIDRRMVMPDPNSFVTDFGPDYLKPKFYNVVGNTSTMPSQRIHYSRVIRATGIDLPYQQQITEQGWGMSVIERLYDRLLAFDSTTQGAAQLVFKAHLRTFSVEGLRQIIASGGQAFEGLIKHIDMIRQFQSNEGLTLMDATDKFEAHQYTFAGLNDVLLQFGQQLSGATGIPLVRLFGQSPSGMNATGESDLRTYYDLIRQQQKRKLRTPWKRLLDVAYRSVLGEQVPDGFNFKFRSLWQMSDTDKATIVGTVTTAVTSAYTAGLVDQATALKELRKSSEVTGVWGSITDEDIEDAENALPEVGESDDSNIGQGTQEQETEAEAQGPKKSSSIEGGGE